MLARIIDGQLNASAWIVLSILGLIIIGGLSWCFYRAIIAASKDAGEQHPDEV